MTGIYMWTSPSGKKYVGQAKDLKVRYSAFISPSKLYTTKKGRKLTAIDQARQKYSDFSQWKYEVLQECKEEELSSLEEYYIDVYETFNPDKGYNLTKGGEGTKGFVPDTAFKAGRKRTEQEIERSKETLKLHKELGLIDFGRGKRVSPWKGKHRPKETNEKISNTLKGNIPWNKGKTGIYSDECKESNKKKHKPTPVLQFTLDGEFLKRWDYMSDAARELNICKQSISNCCRHCVRQAGGFWWEYAS